mgnify:CR=1 FL=1
MCIRDRAYINGVQDTSLSRTLGANVGYTSNSQFALGVRSGNFGSYGYYNGSIDQFRFFNSALSSTDVSDLYNEHYGTLYTEGSDTVLIFNRGTGNINFTYAGSAPPTGAIRTNTDSSPGSANSGIEVYNGTQFNTPAHILTSARVQKWALRVRACVGCRGEQGCHFK